MNATNAIPTAAGNSTLAVLEARTSGQAEAGQAGGDVPDHRQLVRRGRATATSAVAPTTAMQHAGQLRRDPPQAEDQHQATPAPIASAVAVGLIQPGDEVVHPVQEALPLRPSSRTASAAALTITVTRDPRQVAERAPGTDSSSVTNPNRASPPASMIAPTVSAEQPGQGDPLVRVPGRPAG